MIKTIVLMGTVLLCVQSMAGATLDAETATLAGPVLAPKDTWADTGLAQILTVPAGGAHVLVFATLSTRAATGDTPQARTGSWRLSDGTSDSLNIDRTISKGATDSGAVSVMHIFTYASGGTKTYRLQHQTSASVGGKLAETYDMTIVAESLKTSDGIALAEGQDTTGEYEFQTTSTELVTVQRDATTELKATVALSAAAGKIVVLCSFNATSPEIEATAKTGMWELHIRKTGETITTKVGEATQRYIDPETYKDTGAGTLTGIADSWNGAPLEAGAAYDILLKAKTTAGTLITKNVTLSAFAVSYMDISGTPAPHAFPARQSTIASATSSTTSGWQETGVAFTHNLPPVIGAKILLGSSYTCASGPTLPGTGRRGDFRLAADTPNTSMKVRRYLSRLNDRGSCGNVGLTEAATGSNAVKLQYQPVEFGYDIKLINPVLASVVLTSESQPPTQACDISFDTTGQTFIDLSWVNGDGFARLVICRQGSAPSSGPVDGTTYTASSTYGAGSELDDGYVVYIGTGESLTVNGLTASTKYYFQVYEYNFSGTYVDYSTQTAESNPNNTTTIPEPGIAGLIAGAWLLFARRVK